MHEAFDRKGVTKRVSKRCDLRVVDTCGVRALRDITAVDVFVHRVARQIEYRCRAFGRETLR